MKKGCDFPHPRCRARQEACIDHKERASDLLQDIGAAIVEDPALEDKEWDAIALVFQFDGMSRLYGYSYRDETSEPFSPEDDVLFDLFLELQEVMAEGEDCAWKACLYKITKPDMDLDVDFEYEDGDRWRVTPENIDTIAEMIRPR